MENQRSIWTGGPSKMGELSAIDGCETWKEKLWSESGMFELVIFKRSSILRNHLRMKIQPKEIVRNIFLIKTLSRICVRN